MDFTSKMQEVDRLSETLRNRIPEMSRELDMSGYCLFAFNAAQAYFIPVKNMNNPRLAKGLALSWEDMIERRRHRINLGLKECFLEKEALLKMHAKRQEDHKSWRHKMPLPKSLL